MLNQFYRKPALSDAKERELIRQVRAALRLEIGEIETEYCFYVEAAGRLTEEGKTILSWLLGETFEPEGFGDRSFLSADGICLEVGPRLSFKTAWCTNAVAVCHSCGLEEITRIERSRRYLLRRTGRLSDRQRRRFLELVHDRMTEFPYSAPLTSFDGAVRPEASFQVPVLQEGRGALERLNREAGLAFDDWDLDYYTDLFAGRLGRNPTNVECFDIAQSNSEHSRHWFFKGRMVIDGQEQAASLMELIQEPMRANSRNSVLAFRDNSSAIRGYRIETLLPSEPGSPGPMAVSQVDHDIIFTAETHNFPSGVAPFPGAETGTGGRIRDVHATGKGSLVVAGTAAYCVGNLRIPGYELPWEDSDFRYPDNLASPLQIEIEASDGASDYGNKFGEPLIQGFTRSFGLRLPGGERREWIKPIMFTGGLGQIDARHLRKEVPEAGMWVVKIGGPAYRIGLGGGAASSMVQGENVAELDFNAVQRGDAEMEQKVNRVIRACVEMGEGNPIVSIHDQGAGGNCNVLKEIAEPAGARIELRKIPVGDETLSVLEIWVAEYQEQDALLLRPDDSRLFLDLCRREKVPVAFVGRVTGDGRIVLFDERDGSTPVDLELDQVLGSMPRKVFQLERLPLQLRPLRLPASASVREALERVFRLVSVGSKRFLTNKVDRSVTGLVAQQQCVGPLQLTLSDVSVIAQSHFGSTGAATAIGERPILGLLDPGAMARMSLAEALTNLVWAPVSHLQDVKCSGNWMWPAKLPGEGARVYAAAMALRDTLLELGIAVDGGKDSLSMAALAPLGDSGREETVKAPGALVLSAYVTCSDITQTVTPDLKLPGRGRLLFLDLSSGRNRLGGSALAQVYGQLGNEPPDLEDVRLLGRAFEAVQTLIGERLLASGHDRSEGGLLTTILEMAFAGDCGVEVNLENAEGKEVLPLLFSEELGLILEVSPEGEARVRRILKDADIPCRVIGRTLPEPPGRNPGGRRRRAGGRHPGTAGSLGGDQLPDRTASSQSGMRPSGAPFSETAAGSGLLTLVHSPGHGAGPARGRGASPGGHLARRGKQRRPGDGVRLSSGRFRILGRDHVRPALRLRPTLLIPRSRVRGRLQLRGRLGLGEGLGRRHPVQSGALGTVRALLPSARQFQPGSVQRLSAHGPPGLDPLEGNRDRGPTAIRTQPIRTIRVPFLHGSYPGESGADVEGDDRIRPGNLGEPWGGASILSAAVHAGSDPGSGLGAHPLCGRRGSGYRRLPAQPQRVGGRNRRALLPRRPPSRHDAPSGANLPEMAMGLDAPGLEGSSGSFPLAPALPERPGMVRSMSLRLDSEALARMILQSSPSIRLRTGDPHEFGVD